MDGREITFSSSKVNSNDEIASNISLTLKIKVILDDNKILPHPKVYTDLPNIYISNDIGEENHFKNGSLSINVEEDYEKEISSELKEICNKNHYDLKSKSEQKASFNNMKVVIGILGGGIAFILILIGLINFVNVMITGINVRLSEFAVLESIGMTKKQQNKMVTIEGLYYGLISTIFLYTIGSVVMYLFTLLTKKIVSYAEFSYPIVQMLLLTLAIMIIFSLSKEGYNVISAYTLEEGKMQLEKEDIDLLLLDINLPDGDGFEFAKNNKLNTKVVFLTANDTEEDMVKGYEMGCEDYIPFHNLFL